MVTTLLNESSVCTSNIAKMITADMTAHEMNALENKVHFVNVASCKDQ